MWFKIYLCANSQTNSSWNSNHPRGSFWPALSMYSVAHRWATSPWKGLKLPQQLNYRSTLQWSDNPDSRARYSSRLWASCRYRFSTGQNKSRILLRWITSEALQFRLRVLDFYAHIEIIFYICYIGIHERTNRYELIFHSTLLVTEKSVGLRPTWRKILAPPLHQLLRLFHLAMSPSWSARLSWNLIAICSL